MGSSITTAYRFSSYTRIISHKLFQNLIIFSSDQISFSLIRISFLGIFPRWTIYFRGDCMLHHFFEPKEKAKGSSSMSIGRDTHIHPCLRADVLPHFMVDKKVICALSFYSFFFESSESPFCF